MPFAPHLFCICGSGHATAAVLLPGFAISLWQSHAGSRTAAVLWPDPYVFTVYMTHILSVYILYGHTNDALILATSYLHIHFSYVHECILTALYCAVFVLLMHVFLWLSLQLSLYIVRNYENKDDQPINVLEPLSQWYPLPSRFGPHVITVKKSSCCIHDKEHYYAIGVGIV